MMTIMVMMMIIIIIIIKNNIRLHLYKNQLPRCTGTVVYEQFVCFLVRIYDVLYYFPVRRENRRVGALCARRCGSAEHWGDKVDVTCGVICGGHSTCDVVTALDFITS
jgi:hypothetical protein